MEIKIHVSDDELVALCAAVTELNNIQHLKFMSRSMLAEQANINPNKMRAVLQEALNRKLLTQYQATTNPKLQRYYYVLTEEGKALLK